MNDNPARHYNPVWPWFVWVIATLFYGYECFLQISPTVMVPELMRDFNVNAAMLGNLAAFYFYSYTFMQIPSGILLDRLGPRRLLTATCILCATGALLFASATKLPMAQLGRLLIGFGSAFAVIGVFKIAANWFSPRRFALITGLTVAIGMTGAVAAGAPLAALVDLIGWRQSLFLLAGVGFLVALLIWIVVRDKPKASADSKACYQQPPQTSVMNSLKYLVVKKQNWLVAIYGGLMFAPTSAFAGLWGVPFISAAYNVSRPVAGGAISMIFIGWAIGGPILGWISDTIEKRKPTMVFASILGFIDLTLVIYGHFHISFLYILLFCFGFFCSGFLPSFSIIRELNPPETSATALGFMNTLNMIGGAVLQPFIGFLLDLKWDNTMVNGVRSYNLDHYHFALAVLPIILFIAILILPFIKETYGRTFDEMQQDPDKQPKPNADYHMNMMESVSNLS